MTRLPASLTVLASITVLAFNQIRVCSMHVHFGYRPIDPVQCTDQALELRMVAQCLQRFPRATGAAADNGIQGGHLHRIAML